MLLKDAGGAAAGILATLDGIICSMLLSEGFGVLGIAYGSEFWERLHYMRCWYAGQQGVISVLASLPRTYKTGGKYRKGRAGP